MTKTKKLTAIILAGLMTVSFSGCKFIKKTQAGINAETVAKIGDRKITRGELDATTDVKMLMSSVEKEYGKNIKPNTKVFEDVKYQKSYILSKMLSEEVVLKKAEELKLIPDDAKLNKEINEKYEEQKKALEKQNKKLTDLMKEQGITEEDLKRDIKRKIIMDKVIENTIKDVTVTDADAEDFYKKNTTQFTEKPNRIHTSHILVDTEEEAKDIKAKLDKGANFAALAKEKSKDQGSKDKGGDLGFVNYVNSGFVQEYMDAAIALKEGQISEPVKSQHGYHIIKTIKKEEYPVKAFDKVKAEIKENLLNNKKSTEFQNKLSEWMTKEKIEFKNYENNLL